MNKALSLTNWDKGGRYYIKKAASENKWVGFQESVIDQLRTKFGDDFYIVIWSDVNKENDFFNIPFDKLKHVFAKEHKTTGKYTNRWTAVIQDESFLMHGSHQLAIDISGDYGNLHDQIHCDTTSPEDDLAYFELENEYFEGEKKTRLSNYYERRPELRRAAIREHGTKCEVCNFDFKEFYGEHGTGYIEVHHIIPVSKLGISTKVNPVTDMIVVCANCHRMLHHQGKATILSPKDLKELIHRK